MMFASPRVIVVDDDQDHLDGLVGGLHRGGVACLPIHFTGDTSSIKPCPDVRVVFTDLNLIGQGSDHPAQYAALGGLLEGTIMPRGPYVVVLWTRYPEQAAGLQSFLSQRLRGVTKPFAVLRLEKAEHLDGRGRVRDEGSLIAAVVALTNNQPQVGALFDWETRVLGAAGSTVSSVLALGSSEAPDERAAEVGRILSSLGIGAVGKEHLGDDRFRAVNDALLPILADRISNLRSTPGAEAVWQAAMGAPAGQQLLTNEEAARLNRMIHVDISDKDSSGRGAVITLPLRLKQDFDSCFGLDETTAAREQFNCSGFAPGDSQFRWVLVQTQAACDYAQSRPGPTPAISVSNFRFRARQRGNRRRHCGLVRRWS